MSGNPSGQSRSPLYSIAELLERHHIKCVRAQRRQAHGIVSRANLLHGLATTIVDRHEPGAASACECGVFCRTHPQPVMT
jgi:hypothetical protein